MYRYNLRSLGASSVKYGPCEVCGGHVSDVFYQSEERQYTTPEGEVSYTRYQCKDLFGHEKCLINTQKK